MDDLWRNYQMNWQPGMPIIGRPYQSQGMDGLLMYLRLPTQTRTGFVPGAVVPLSSEAQDEPQESPNLILTRTGLFHPQLSETKGQESPVTRLELILEAIRHNEAQTFKTPNLELTSRPTPTERTKQ